MADPAQGEPNKRLTRMSYRAGPMGYLTDQIIKEMQRAGYPAKLFVLYRDPDQQEREYADGDSRARAYQSAHQYFGASDIIHERWAWFAAHAAPDGAQFWDTLWDCVEVVSERHGVEFEKRLSWDAAHIELADWKNFRLLVGRREPSQAQLDAWFARLLPKVWQAHIEAQKNRKTAP